MAQAVLIDGLRSPFVKSGSKLNDVPAHELATVVVRDLLAKLDLSADVVDEVIFGNISQSSDAANVARVIALNAGLPFSIPAHTVVRNCASGMEAISEACDRIHLNESEVIVCGGVESMSNIPLIFPKNYTNFLAEWMKAKSWVQKLKTLSSFRLSMFSPRVALLEGLTDPFCGLSMGHTAEVLAREWNISRKAQDEYALQSHRLAVKAGQDGKFLDEMTPFYLPPKYDEVIQEDIGPRSQQSMEQLSKLKPVFDKYYGSVTAGNSCQITDGAVAAVIMSSEKAASLGYEPLATVKSHAAVGTDPKRMGLGPVFAMHKALQKANLQLSDMELIELNEAFAAQVLAVCNACESEKFAKEKLGLDAPLGNIRKEILNVNGGAIALGHPVGASGARLVVTLAKEMKRRHLRYGLATLCVGGGQGAAMILEAGT
ncbi:MAG: thiolase family protein [Deltaproteobacteria bacterium]|nr:thiolase family protein [Deltaproteobacteria bacterium]